MTKTKLLYLLSCLIILLFSYSKGFSQIKKKGGKVFHNETKSTVDVKIMSEDCASINYKNIEYQILHLQNSQLKNKGPYIVKYEINVSPICNSEKVEERKYEVSVYNLDKNEPVIAFTKEADVLTFDAINNDFYVWEAFTNGCCMAPSIVEVLDVMGKKSLVTSIDKYFTIVNNKTKDTYLFGFTGMNYEGYKAGYFGTINYSINQKKTQTIRIKVDTTTHQYYEYIFDKKPEVSFITLLGDSTNSTDSTKEHRESYNIFNDSLDSIKKINNVGLRFTYFDYWTSDGIYKKVTYDLLIKDGEIKEKEIFLKFE